MKAHVCDICGQPACPPGVEPRRVKVVALIVGTPLDCKVIIDVCNDCHKKMEAP